MTSLTMLAALLLAQPYSDPNEVRGVPIAAWDVAFIQAQEEWVIGLLPPRDELAIERLVPVYAAHKFTAMGVSCWHCRDAAKRDLAEHLKDDPRWLFWGARWPDPEVRFRCENLIRAAARCRSCEGRGGSDEHGYWSTCGMCRGHGRYWPLELFLNP